MGEILLNGRQHEIPAGTTLTHLLSELELDPRWVVAELNGKPLERERFATVVLAAGDRLELVRPVAGG